MARSRDDFSTKTAEALAKRACYHCSNPDCRVPTLSPSVAEPGKWVYTGIAAHITAAAKDGPRFDPALTPLQRANVSNGIHLCGTCSIRIDKNGGADYPADLLRNWKTAHETWVTSLHKRDVDALEAASRERFTRQIGADILTLRRYSRMAVSLLTSHSTIQANGISVSINRPARARLKSEITAAGLVVVGEPGAGKSSCCAEAAAELAAAGHEVVVLPADRLAASSLGALRDELGLALQIHDVLAHWPGGKPGVLLIDGLDAARSKDAAQALLDLVRLVAGSGPRWHVLVSIRKFDLRYSDDLRKLFAGTGVAEYADPEFTRVRHFSVPVLSDAELAQIGPQFPELAELVANASQDLRRLMRVPFNLRLTAEILAGGSTVESLGTVSTQVELLERYWHERVLRGDGHGDAREAVARQATSEMIARRSLRADRRAVANDPAASRALADLLSSHVLTEWLRPGRTRPESAILAFTHNILFDYAAARLHLRGLPETFAKLLADESDLLIAIRPSIIMHFQYEWTLDPDHGGFWETVEEVARRAGIREIGKLIGPGVAAELCASAADYSYLLAAIAEPERRPAALAVLRHVVLAMLAAGRPLAGEGAAPALGLVDSVSQLDDEEATAAVMPLLSQAVERPELLTAEQGRAAALIASRILGSALEARV